MLNTITVRPAARHAFSATYPACELLSRYRADQGRLSFLNTLIPRLQKRLEEVRAEGYESVAAQDWSFLPRGSAPGDPTAWLALRAASGRPDEEEEALARQIRQYEIERRELEARISYAESLLLPLRGEDRLLLERRLVERDRWEQVQAAYRETFGRVPSRSTLIRRLERLLEALEGRGASCAR